MDFHFPLILDGATGTQLQSHGYTGAESAEEWVLAHPEVLTDIQRSYVDAGSRVLYAPTFSANRRKLAERGIVGQTAEINRRLVNLSRKAADGRALVAGDMSPTGLFVQPIGDTPFEEVVDIYTEQAAALEAAGVDLFVIETMMTLSDARAAVLAVRSVSDKPIFVTFSCSENGRSVSGTDVTAALTVLQGMGIDAFGLNCSTGPENMLCQLRRLREYALVPLIAKPNAGLPKLVNSKTVYDCPPEEFAAFVPQMLETGVAVFGGCCGTTAEHIAALQKALEGAKITPPAPLYADLLPAATEQNCVYIPASAEHGEILRVTEDFEEDLSDALEEDDAVLAVRLETAEDVKTFIESTYMIRKPLCLVCEDAAVLESVLRAYQGRTLYEGSLPEQILRPLREKYGLIY